MYENKKILILGAAKSGLAAASLLANKNNDITLSDINPLKKEDEMMLNELGIKIIITPNQVDLIDSSYDLVIKNPAIMSTSDIVKKLENLGIRTENEMEVAYHYLPQNITIIGITGSNGKTTTTTIIYELLKRHGKNTVLGGNIGTPLSTLVTKIKPQDILLLEISDHQLCDLHDFKTDISILTNICPTHLDYHGTYEHYMDTKKKIFNHHTKNEIAIINKANADSLKITEDILSTKIYFNDNKNYIDDKYIYLNGEKYLNIADINIKGIHNYENILAALLVLQSSDLDKEIVTTFLKQFNGVEHRLEFVLEKDKVKYYNDSKSTNPTSTITALKTFKNSIHLILGGLERYQDFNELNDYLKYVKHIYAIGEVTKRVAEYAKNVQIPCTECVTLSKALAEIKKNVVANEIVLLSPASSSQDQYKKFEERGEEFKNIVENF